MDFWSLGQEYQVSESISLSPSRALEISGAVDAGVKVHIIIIRGESDHIAVDIGEVVQHPPLVVLIKAAQIKFVIGSNQVKVGVVHLAVDATRVRQPNLEVEVASVQKAEMNCVST